MWYLLSYFSFAAGQFIILAAGEIITVTKEKDITCAITGDSVRSTVYLHPPTEAGFLKSPTRINKWIVDDWTIVNSADTYQDIVIDKRWEDFEMLREDSGYALLDNSLSFSVCATGNFSFDIFSSDFFTERWLEITPSPLKLSKQNVCTWFHYTLTKQGTAINLISTDKVQTFDVGFDPYWIYIKNTSGSTTFWKLHNYNFRTATTTTQEQKETKVSVNFTDNLCLSMYVSVDKNSFLDVVLETTGNVTKETIIGFNEENALKQWQRIEIEAADFGEGTISFFRGLTQQSERQGYWAIDQISFCSKSIEVLKTSLKDEDEGNYICKSLNDPTEETNQNILNCDKPGFLGKNCGISCNTVLGSSYSYCENHMICQDATSCFCSWGYQGNECKQTCAPGTWGLFCKNKCSVRCDQKCHPSTGECSDLKPELKMIRAEKITAVVREKLTENDLPTSVTINTNNINILWSSVRENTKDLLYHIKYICTSSWCNDQVFENYTIKVPSENFVHDKFENFVPLTEYQASVTVEGFNQSLEKRYEIVRTDDVYAVENVSIYSKNFNTLWIKFRVSEVPVGGFPYKIWYNEIHSESRPGSVETVLHCQLWDKYLCGKIDNLKAETLYEIMVEHVETQHQKWGLSKKSQSVTSESTSSAPENLKVVWDPDGKAIVSWNHPAITNGPIRKFVLEVQTKESIKNYTVDVAESQKTYALKIPVEHNYQYRISVRGFNKYKGEKSTITAIFLPFQSSFSNGTIIEACGKTCDLLVPKPEDLQYKSNYRIVGIPVNDKSENIEKMLYNKIDPNERGWIILEDTGVDQEYFTSNINTESANIFSLNIRDYSLYLVQGNNNNDYSIYQLEILEEKIEEGAPVVLSSVTYIVLITIVSLSLILLLFLLLLKFRRNNAAKKNIFHQEYHIVEENTFMGGNEPQKPFKISTSCFESYLKNALHTGKDIIAQFRSLPAATRPMVHAFDPKNKNKNKDNENISYDHNRIVLEKMEGMGGDDYINASYIDGYERPKTYIATQGPKFYTVRDFWRMVWQEQVETIVMATNFMENKKRKCAEYFPQKINTTFQCGQMLIKLIKEELYEYHTIRIFEVHYKRSIREIQHFHLRWNPDNFTPLYPNCIVPLVKTISVIREKSNKPILIHCSSGSNRTGTLILCDLALHMANLNGNVDFYTLLKRIRDQRPNMVCSEKQYILAHLVILECLMEQENAFKKSIRENFQSSILKSQLKYVKRLSWHDDVVQNWAPRRSYLNNYSYMIYPVDGYGINKKFFTTQMPTKNLINNFWEMTIQEKIGTIVLLDQEKYEMWPYQSQNHNTFLTVKKLQSWETSYCSLTKLSLVFYNLPSNNILHEQIINLFAANYSCETNVMKTSNILNMLDDVNQNNCSQKPILVTCHDGVGKSGLFVTLDYIIEKCKKEFEIDVCNGLRNVRRSGLPFIKTPAEMEFLYRTSLDYLRQFDEYSYVL